MKRVKPAVVQKYHYRVTHDPRWGHRKFLKVMCDLGLFVPMRYVSAEELKKCGGVIYAQVDSPRGEALRIIQPGYYRVKKIRVVEGYGGNRWGKGIQHWSGGVKGINATAYPMEFFNWWQDGESKGHKAVELKNTEACFNTKRTDRAAKRTAKVKKSLLNGSQRTMGIKFFQKLAMIGSIKTKIK